MLAAKSPGAQINAEGGQSQNHGDLAQARQVFDYVKRPGIDKKWKSLRVRLDKALPSAQQAACCDCPGGWAFETKHLHPYGKAIRVVHYGINFHR